MVKILRVGEGDDLSKISEVSGGIRGLAGWY